uniref:Uncharacterized protein n=1 Tax=Avena sativa TaxID=4498 RepID=A0ACD5YWL6_AVESA
MSMLETKSPMCDSLRGLFSWMQSYFHDCPDSLKPCIFYLSIFPSYHNIRRRRLVRRWIAEGYSTEENGEKLFSELIKLSIIQQKLPCKAGLCQFNGFFREYIISRPMQDNLVFELEGHCSLDSQRAGQHLTISSSWDRAKILFESLELSRLRSLTVFGEWRSFFISADANMRLIRVLDLEDTSGVKDSDLENIGNLMPRLKFLSLRGCKDITRMPSSLGCLSQLQTLDIKGTSIVMLPAALMKLEKLQYVRAGATTSCISTPSEDDNRTVAGEATPPQTDVDGTRTSQPRRAAASQNEAGTSASLSSRPLCELAFGWLSMFRRNVLGSSAHHDGVRFSDAAIGGIWKLRALHTLGGVNVEGSCGKAVLRELKNLSQLRKLRLFGISRINWQDFCFSISGHGYLESLSVRFGDEQQDHWYWLDDISEPPETLKRLKLYEGNVRLSPAWMKKIDKHTKVNLENVEMTVSTQEDIDGLRELQGQDMYPRLCVKPIQDGKLRYGWPHNFWPGRLFEAAKILKMECGSYRLEIVFEKWIPEPVEVLVIHCSTSKASLKLFGLDEHLPNLKEVILKGTYNEAVKKHLQDEAAKHPMKPLLKLEDQHLYCPS